MTDLKPCPFCGGEIEIVKTDCNDPIHGYGLIHENNDCILNNDGYLQIYSTEEQAIDAWNTRTEKTCQVIGYSVTSHDRVLMCQLSCGHRVPSLDVGPFNPSFSHCPRCNAKVVQDVY